MTTPPAVASSEVASSVPRSHPVDDYRPVAAWRSVGVLMIFMLFSIMDRQIIALMVDPIKADLGLSDTELGLLQGLAFALLYSIAGLPIGWAVDRFSRRTIIFVGIMTWSLSAAACGLARNFWQLFLGRTFVGIGEASMGPAAVSLIGDLFPRDKVAAPMGVYSAGYYLGAGVALAVGGWIVGYFVSRPPIELPLIGVVAPWQAVFIATGLPGILAAFLAFLIYDPRGKRPVNAPSETRRQGFLDFLRLRKRLVGLTIAGFAIATYMNYAIGAWTPTYFMRVHGWAASDIGWTYGLVVALSGAAGALAGGIFMDRVYRSGRTDAYLLVSAIASLCALPFLFLAYFVQPTLALVLLCVGMSLAGVVSAGSYATWQRIAPPEFRGRLTAVFILIASLVGAGLGPLTVGAITDYIFKDEFEVGSSIAVAVALSAPSMALLFQLGRRSLRELPD